MRRYNSGKVTTNKPRSLGTNAKDLGVGRRRNFLGITNSPDPGSNLHLDGGFTGEVSSSSPKSSSGALLRQLLHTAYLLSVNEVRVSHEGKMLSIALGTAPSGHNNKDLVCLTTGMEQCHTIEMRAPCSIFNTSVENRMQYHRARN